MNIGLKLAELRSDAIAFRDYSVSHEYSGWRVYVKSDMATKAMKLTWKEAVAWCKTYNEIMKEHRHTYFARMEREDSPRRRPRQFCKHCGSAI